MQELKLTLETITPLFLAGADPHGEPELRAPSLRGAMRYWLRAALGGVIGSENLAALKRRESDVFGSTEGMGAVNVRLLSSIVSGDRRTYEKSPARPGQGYLYWSMAASGEQPRQYVRGDKSFDVMLASPVEADDWRWFAGRAALWLLVQLGGLGSRSRRTAGSLGAKPTDLGDGLRLANGDSPEAFSKVLGRGITTIRQRLARDIPSGSLGAVPAFDVIQPEHCSVWVIAEERLWATADAAVEAIGVKLREFRSRRQPDSARVAAWLNGDQIETVQRAVFGLPLPFRYSSLGSATVQGSNHQRRASPLWLKIARLDKQYVGVATLFRSAFLPEGEKLRARGPLALPPADYGLIEQFVGEFRRHLEVKL
ncbi:MAG: type III-B CRISPR module RAMP protein Cmr1 [Chloroflexi bacterium]|nr:type III-B CRISPR module RAMP protein Cmr1 [Chloroflexota bacterium]